MSEKILIVDDEKEIVELVALYLREKYEIFKAYDGVQALEIIKKEDIDLVIADIMMPNMDGYSLIRSIREVNDIPIIVISAKGEGYEKILGLDIGADDYITKPFDPLEVAARVNAQIRRYRNGANSAQSQEYKNDNQINIGDLILDKNKFSIIKSGEEKPLTSMEYKILELFMSNPNKVFTKKNLFESVWNEPFFHEDNIIMVHISNIRDKIEDDNKSPKYIKTIRGLGYKFEK
ncbi:MAG: response regulator transcription factor [Clostridium sp.]